MSSVFQAHTDSGSRNVVKSPGEIVDSCFTLTADALKSSGVANESEILKALSSVREGQANGEPLDMLEALARIQGHDEERLGTAIRTLGDAVGSTLHPVPPTIPFANKLIAPSAFYDSFDTMHALGKLLLTPVIYAEDTDAIGTASINPIAALLLGEEIFTAVGKRLGIRPFITIARMEYESWSFLCRKHFEL